MLIIFYYPFILLFLLTPKRYSYFFSITYIYFLSFYYTFLWKGAFYIGELGFLLYTTIYIYYMPSYPY